MVYILHIDTSAEKGTVALAADGQLLSVIENPDARSHASTINLNIASLLEKQDIALKDISAYSVCGGPGSYTGLRIGLATAKGFCYATDAKLMMDNKLLLMACSLQNKNSDCNLMMPVLKAREGEYFVAVYNNNLETITEPRHVHLQDFESILPPTKDKICLLGYENDNIGELAAQYDLPSSTLDSLDYEAWAAYAFAQFNGNNFVNQANSEPFYLKQVYTHNKKTIN